MSLTLIKPYFKVRCEAVGLKPVGDAFDNENIATTVINYGYNIEFFSASGVSINQNTQDISVPVDVVFFVKGFRSPQDGFDKAIVKVEQLIKEVEAPANRLGSCLKNVKLNQISIEPFSDSNDNLVKVKTSFDVFTSLIL